jgi:hypothetical protein
MTKERARTQREKVLKRLERGIGITSMEAFSEYGITRLSSCIFDLRKMGYDIETRMVWVTCRDGGRAHVARYVLKEAGHAGK